MCIRDRKMESDAVDKLLLLIPAFYGMTLGILFFLIYFVCKYQFERIRHELSLIHIYEQCEKINLLLGILNAGQDASALCPIATEAALTMLDILSQTPPFSYMNISKHRERIENCLLYTSRCV